MGFCPECGSMLIPSKGLFKCRKCGYVCRFSGKSQIVDQTEPQWCFCHRYRCHHKDYSICPKDCEEPGPVSRCINICEFARQHPEECKKLVIQLQEAAGETPENIPSYKV